MNDNTFIIDLMNAPFTKCYDGLPDVLGFSAACWLGALMNRYSYLKNNGKVDENDWFPCNQSIMQKRLGLSKSRQSAIIKKVVGEGFLEVEGKGIPRRNYYRINQIAVRNAILNARVNQTEIQGLKKVNTCVNQTRNHYKNSSNKNNSKNSLCIKYKEKGKASLLPNKFSRQSKKLSNRTRPLVKPKPVQSPIAKQKQMLERDILYYEQKDEHIRKLFLYWNTLDITNHKDTVTKTKLNSYKQLDKQLDKYTPDEISDSFDCYAKLVEKYPNKFCKAPYKCSLPEFFKWSAQQRSMIRNKKDLNSIKSIFYVCKMGYSYTLKYFENKKTIVNCNRKILSAVQKYGLELLDDRRIKQNADILAKVCVRLEKFYKSYQNKLTGLNGNGARGLAMLLWNYVDEENDLDNFKLWWLNSDNMFNGFEQWLEDNGYLNNTNSCYRDAEYDEHGNIIKCRL